MVRVPVASTRRLSFHSGWALLRRSERGGGWWVTGVKTLCTRSAGAQPMRRRTLPCTGALLLGSFDLARSPGAATTPWPAPRTEGTAAQLLPGLGLDMPPRGRSERRLRTELPASKLRREPVTPGRELRAHFDRVARVRGVERDKPLGQAATRAAAVRRAGAAARRETCGTSGERGPRRAGTGAGRRRQRAPDAGEAP